MDNKEQYPRRISYSGSAEPGIGTLTGLQKNHLLHVPFENLDIHFGVPIELDLDRIYQKIVVKRRGGFCYELNGLFRELLVALGFEAKRVSARVYDPRNGYGEAFDHLALIVVVNGEEYLSDVGFGEFAFSPLKLDPGIVQRDPRGDFIIEEHPGGYFRVSRIENGRASPQYIFDLKERQFSEYRAMCRYHQTSPDSHFTQKRLISRPTENGRITISGNVLKITEGPFTQELSLENEELFRLSLKKYFDIDLDQENTKPI